MGIFDRLTGNKGDEASSKGTEAPRSTLQATEAPPKTERKAGVTSAKMREMAHYTVFLTETGDLEIAHAGTVLDLLADYTDADDAGKETLMTHMATTFAKGGMDQFRTGMKKLQYLAGAFKDNPDWADAHKRAVPMMERFEATAKRINIKSAIG